MNPEDEIVPMKLTFKIWFKNVKGTTGCVEIRSSSFEKARRYVYRNKNEIEIAVGCRIAHPMLIVIDGGKA